jgi:hypothetical protein
MDSQFLQSDIVMFKREANESGNSYGIGIFIAKRLLALHKGHLSCGESTDGTSCIFMDLPILFIDSEGASHEEGDTLVDVEAGDGLRIHSISVGSKINLFEYIVALKHPPLQIKMQRAQFAVRHVSGEIKESENVREATPTMTDGTSYHVYNMLILVVDDSALTRKILTKVMLSLGHTCAEAEDGSVAVELMRKALEAGRPYDAVLMDNVSHLPSCHSAIVLPHICNRRCRS